MADKKTIEDWAKRLEKVMREVPKGCWLYIANGTAHVMRLGPDGDRIKKRDGTTFSQDAVIYTLMQIPTIKKTVDDEGYYDMDAASEAVDRLVLKEVRGVLIQTADRNVLAYGPCWCRKDLTNHREQHNEFCLRARALWTKLEVKR